MKHLKELIIISVFALLFIVLENALKIIINEGIEYLPESFWSFILSYIGYLLAIFCFIAGITNIKSKRFGMRDKFGNHTVVKGNKAIVMGVVFIFIGLLFMILNLFTSLGLLEI